MALGLTGKPEEIKKVANAYRVKYGIHNPEDEFYSLDHSANLYIVGPDGKLEMIVPNGLPEEHIIEVVRKLIP